MGFKESCFDITRQQKNKTAIINSNLKVPAFTEPFIPLQSPLAKPKRLFRWNKLLPPSFKPAAMMLSDHGVTFSTNALALLDVITRSERSVMLSPFISAGTYPLVNEPAAFDTFTTSDRSTIPF